MTMSMEVGAALASALLIKGTVIGIGALIVARCARSAAGASLALGIGHGAWGMVILLGPFLPQLNPGVVTIGHGTIEGASIGSLTLSPVLILVGTWAIGVLVMVGRIVRDLRAATALARRAEGQTGTRVEELLTFAAGRIGVRRIPQLRETSELATVALIGFWRPVLLIPVQAREWSDEELFGVFCHELEQYDFYPYREATQRQVMLRYSIGVRSNRYVDTTIYGVLAESRPHHELSLSPNIQRPWGDIFGTTVWSQYLDDPTKRRLTTNLGVNFRITAGLSVNFYGAYSHIRDQLNISGGDLTDEERLLRLRELQSGSYFFTAVGLSYTFGSVFSNVVNPRLRL